MTEVVTGDDEVMPVETKSSPEPKRVTTLSSPIYSRNPRETAGCHHRHHRHPLFSGGEKTRSFRNDVPKKRVLSLGGDLVMTGGDTGTEQETDL
jgi:hypothetical protein